MWDRASASSRAREREPTFGIFIGPHSRREYWCSSKVEELIEISISYKTLLLNRCKINMFQLNTILDLSKLKAFADNIFSVAQMVQIFFDREDNIVGEGVHAG